MKPSTVQPSTITQEHAYMICKDMVYHIAHKFAGSAHQKEQLLDDLIQAGMVGLMQAVTKYDNRRKVKFSTFARYYIYSAIYKERVLNNTLIRKTSSDPALKQVFEEFVDHFIDNDTCVIAESIHNELSKRIKRKLRKFPVKHRNMFIRRYGLFGTAVKPTAVIAKQNKVSKSRVHQICKNIKQHLKDNMSNNEVGDLLKALDTDI